MINKKLNDFFEASKTFKESYDFVPKLLDLEEYNKPNDEIQFFDQEWSNKEFSDGGET